MQGFMYVCTMGCTVPPEARRWFLVLELQVVAMQVLETEPKSYASVVSALIESSFSLPKKEAGGADFGGPVLLQCSES